MAVVAIPSSEGSSVDTESFGTFSLDETDANGVDVAEGVAFEWRDSSAVAKEVNELARDSARGGRIEGRDGFRAWGVASVEDGAESVLGGYSSCKPGGEGGAG